MLSYWASPQAISSDPVMSGKMNSLPKVVFSKTLDRVEWGKWNNARLVKENVAEEVRRLKQRPGKDMVILGSGSLVSALTEQGLIDEYRIIVCPVVLGNGQPLFSNIPKPVNLNLNGTTPFKTGVVMLSYAPDL